MASETKLTKDDKALAAEREKETARPAPADHAAPPPKSSGKPSFFAIYKKGQGYWTRMGTAIGAGLLGALITWQIYDRVPAFFSSQKVRLFWISALQVTPRTLGLICAAVFVTLYGLFAWRLMNKAGNVDFLIATDGEMKKVNWTSKRELIGSTKVVILFMFGIALFLFLLDQLFSAVFYAMGVLKIAPPWWNFIFGG